MVHGSISYHFHPSKYIKVVILKIEIVIENHYC